jgi:hypothetical protein
MSGNLLIYINLRVVVYKTESTFPRRTAPNRMLRIQLFPALARRDTLVQNGTNFVPRAFILCDANKGATKTGNEAENGETDIPYPFF